MIDTTAIKNHTNDLVLETTYVASRLWLFRKYNYKTKTYRFLRVSFSLSELKGLRIVGIVCCTDCKAPCDIELYK